MAKKDVGNEAIYDARTLGTPKMLVLGFQHLFAMFGATVLVPIITGLSVSTTLLFAGIATLFMHFTPPWRPATPSSRVSCTPASA